MFRNNGDGTFEEVSARTKLGEKEAAMEPFRQPIRLKSDFPVAHYNLAVYPGQEIRYIKIPIRTRKFTLKLSVQKVAAVKVDDLPADYI